MTRRYILLKGAPGAMLKLSPGPGSGIEAEVKMERGEYGPLRAYLASVGDPQRPPLLIALLEQKGGAMTCRRAITKGELNVAGVDPATAGCAVFRGRGGRGSLIAWGGMEKEEAEHLALLAGSTAPDGPPPNREAGTNEKGGGAVPAPEGGTKAGPILEGTAHHSPSKPPQYITPIPPLLPQNNENPVTALSSEIEAPAVSAVPAILAPTPACPAAPHPPPEKSTRPPLPDFKERYGTDFGLKWSQGSFMGLDFDNPAIRLVLSGKAALSAIMSAGGFYIGEGAGDGIIVLAVPYSAKSGEPIPFMHLFRALSYLSSVGDDAEGCLTIGVDLQKNTVFPAIFKINSPVVTENKDIPR